MKAPLAMRARSRQRFEERHSRLRDDLLGALARAQQEGDRLSADGLFGTCVPILVAGHETTTDRIGDAVSVLLRARRSPLLAF